jgi:hypothetical protein
MCRRKRKCENGLKRAMQFKKAFDVWSETWKLFTLLDTEKGTW